MNEGEREEVASEVVDLFEADLRTYESVMVNWKSKEEIEANSNGSSIPLRPGPPLPPFSTREDGIALSTIEVLRRDTFEEWNVPKPLLRALLRYVIPRDSQVADFCAGIGTAASFLNDTGLVRAYAFDASSNIKLLSRNAVEYLRLYSEEAKLWTTFDVTMCLSAAADYGPKPEVWAQVWRNLEANTRRTAVLTCGLGEARQEAMSAAATHAPSLSYDEQLSSQIDELHPGTCIFWRKPGP